MRADPSSWLNSGRPRGQDYDEQLAARLAGRDPHGEANFVEGAAARLLNAGGRPIRVLDGGCGTGRVGIELARRGFDVTGVDIDRAMLDVARQKAPDLDWQVDDLAEFTAGQLFTVAVLAGNVMIFVGRGREPAVVGNLAALIEPSGLLIAGFELTSGGLTLAEYDAICARRGLELAERWSTWDAAGWYDACGYAVSVHRRL